MNFHIFFYIVCQKLACKICNAFNKSHENKFILKIGNTAKKFRQSCATAHKMAFFYIYNISRKELCRNVFLFNSQFNIECAKPKFLQFFLIVGLFGHKISFAKHIFLNILVACPFLFSH